MKQFKLSIILFSVLLASSMMTNAQVKQFDMEDLQDLIMMNSNGKSGGLGGGTGSDGTGSGGGNSGNTIRLSWPEQGKMVQKNATIEWVSPKSDGPFIVQLSDASNSAIVLFTAVAEGNSVLIPMSNLALEEGMSYTVSVSTKSKRKEKSDIATITIHDNSDREAVMATAVDHADYKSSDKLHKVLMKAMALELNGYTYDAAQLYKSGMESDSDYSILRNMRDAFVQRVGM